mmetsp:Transcript_1720/g.6030  ORF Transcript_1720/g.6030 Transcript_1720/m.6030 type:complete len:243 (+) Transcript_1720:1567-2295(+)
MTHIWVLCSRVISPDAKSVYIRNRAAHFLSNLSQSSVVIQTSERSDSLLRNLGSVLSHDERIGVGRVSHYNNMHLRVCTFLDGLSLRCKDFCICLQEILSLHSLSTRLCAYQNGKVAIVESLLFVAGDNQFVQEWESHILNLLCNSSQCPECVRKLQEFENNRLVGTQQLSVENARNKIVGNGTCSSSYSYNNWLCAFNIGSGHQSWSFACSLLYPFSQLLFVKILWNISGFGSVQQDALQL